MPYWWHHAELSTVLVIILCTSARSNILVTVLAFYSYIYLFVVSSCRVAFIFVSKYLQIVMKCLKVSRLILELKVQTLCTTLQFHLCQYLCLLCAITVVINILLNKIFWRLFIFWLCLPTYLPDLLNETETTLI